MGDRDAGSPGRRLSEAARLVRQRLDAASEPREDRAHGGHVFETPALGVGDAAMDDASDGAGDEYVLDLELIGRIAALGKRERNAAMRALGDAEYERCKKDGKYWALPWRHPAIPYVYTYDKRPLFGCRLCQEAAANEPDDLEARDRSEWTMYPDLYEPHLRLTHGLRDMTEAERHSYFVPLDTYRPLPAKPYMEPVLDVLFGRKRYVAIAKSRDVMGTWSCIVALCHALFFNDGWEGVAQSEKAPKTYELLERVEAVYDRQPKFLKRHGRIAMTKGADKSGTVRLDELGNVLYGVGQGAKQVRQYHPALYFQDESAFQSEAHEAYAAIQPAIRGGGKVWLLSSAAPGFFQTIVEDRSQG